MGWLMDLCPQPDEWVIAERCQRFGVLPSQLKPEDWRTLNIEASRRWLTSWYERWQLMVSKPEMKLSIPFKVMDVLLKLSDRAEERWTKD